eukprot:jgi/Mesvir1/16913/Mv15778-RA.1
MNAPVWANWLGERSEKVPLTSWALTTPSGQSTEEGQHALPVVISVCLEFLHKKGLMVEGLFRLGASSAQVDELLTLALRDKGATFQLPAATSPHTVAALLMRIFSRLSEPLLTHALYTVVVDAGKRTPVAREGIERIVEHLPTLNRHVLEAFCRLLHAIQLNSASNKMTAKNLAIVTAPELLWKDLSAIQFAMAFSDAAPTAGPAALQASLVDDLKCTVNFLEYLIQDAHIIFAS